MEAHGHAQPRGATDRMLRSVSCPTASMCLAVGSAMFTSGDTIVDVQPLAERWDGTKWWLMKPDADSDEQFFDVSCTNVSNCVVVGKSWDFFFHDHTLVERWDGAHWSAMASPDRSGATDSQLAAISCTSASNCFAVGRSRAGSSAKTLAERWNGTHWSIVASANPSNGADAALNAVTCTSVSSCIAVGDQNAGTTKPLAERWNGATWSIVPIPNGSRDQNSLSDVHCTSATNCVAVGSSESSGIVYNEAIEIPLVERWNGTKWSVMSTPTLAPSHYMDSLSGVACTSATSCYALGTVVAHWNGTTWSVMAHSSSVRGDAIVCTSDSNCIAVGGTTKTLAAALFLGRFGADRAPGDASGTSSPSRTTKVPSTITCAMPDDGRVLAAYVA